MLILCIKTGLEPRLRFVATFIRRRKRQRTNLVFASGIGHLLLQRSVLLLLVLDLKRFQIALKPLADKNNTFENTDLHLPVYKCWCCNSAVLLSTD